MDKVCYDINKKNFYSLYKDKINKSKIFTIKKERKTYKIF